MWPISVVNVFLNFFLLIRIYKFIFASLIKLFNKDYSSQDRVISLCFPAVVLTLWYKLESPGVLVQTQIAGTHPEFFIVSQEWRLRICIFSKFSAMLIFVAQGPLYANLCSTVMFITIKWHYAILLWTSIFHYENI